MAASSTETTGWAKASPGDDFQDWGVEQMLPLLCELRPERSSPRQERKQIEWCFCCVPGMSESLNGAMNPSVLEASGGVLCTSDSLSSALSLHYMNPGLKTHFSGVPTVKTCMPPLNFSCVSHWHSRSTPSPGAAFSLESQRGRSWCTEFMQNLSVPLDMKITHRYRCISDAFLLILLMQQISKIQQTEQNISL